MAEIGKIEYRVKIAPRYYVTRYHQNAGGNGGGVETKGVYDSPEVAHEVAFALCKAEHERLGFAPSDERIIYPAGYPASTPNIA